MYGCGQAFFARQKGVTPMGTKLSVKAKEAFMQYSKKMCTRVTIFWMIYRLVNFVVLLIRPELGNALSDLCTGVDTVMIVNMGAYTANSGTEKVAVAYARRRSLYDGYNDDDERSKDDSEDGKDECDNG